MDTKSSNLRKVIVIEKVIGFILLPFMFILCHAVMPPTYPASLLILFNLKLINLLVGG